MKLCKLCGKPEEGHHAFQPVEKPDGCVCDVFTWDVDIIRPACSEYKGNGIQHCQTCEHDKECHR